MTFKDLIHACHPEWQEIVAKAVDNMNKKYLEGLLGNADWLPGPADVFAAFTWPLSKTNYLLLGESPYPRAISANGYAFWDNAVDSLWSPQGLSKAVNKATSLRNFIKMLLVARQDLHTDTSQQAIAALDKANLVPTAKALFEGMMQKGILLLNASLVYSKGKVPYHARYWQVFMDSVLEQLAALKPDIKLILFGKIAEKIPPHILSLGLVAQHPYNISFITNPDVIKFFNPLDLLAYEKT